MTTSILPEVEKQVRYSREDRDYSAYLIVDGQEEYVGSRATRTEAEQLADSAKYELLARGVGGDTTPAPTTPVALPLPPVDVLATAASDLAELARQAEDFGAMRAFDKANFHIHEGVTIISTRGGVLIPSGTRGGIVHRVSNLHGCSCEAALNGRFCWHAALVEIVERAQARAIPASKPRIRITREQVDAGRAARLAKRLAAARAEREMAELFA